MHLTEVQSGTRAHSHSHNSGSNGNDEEAAALIVRHFERLKGQWHGVLQEAVYERSLYLTLCNHLNLFCIPHAALHLFLK